MRALRLIHEALPWVLQRKRRDGRWETYEEQLDGRTMAYERLNSMKARYRKERWRVLPKNEADKYQEGMQATAHKRPKKKKPRPQKPPPARE